MMRILRRTASVDSLAASIALDQSNELDEAADGAQRAEDDDQPRRGAEVFVQPPAQADADANRCRESPGQRIRAGQKSSAAALLLVLVYGRTSGRLHG